MCSLFKFKMTHLNVSAKLTNLQREHTSLNFHLLIHPYILKQRAQVTAFCCSHTKTEQRRRKSSQKTQISRGVMRSGSCPSRRLMVARCSQVVGGSIQQPITANPSLTDPIPDCKISKTMTADLDFIVPFISWL